MGGERAYPGPPALVRCCFLHNLPVLCVPGLRRDRDRCRLLRCRRVGRGRHPRGGIVHGVRLQHRGVLPRQGHILADVGCPRESEDDLDIVIAVLLWDKSISWISVLGFVIFFSGLFAYSYLTFKSRQRATPTKPTEAPKEG